ncbi:MAG: polyprenyl synthetase family protein [Helicobacteraceae bacterium]|nr:polyprenyl synthetase family protein [Helicobacteraceae bacterium]
MEKVESQMNLLVEEVGYSRATELFKTLKGGKRLRAKLIFKIAPNAENAPRLGAIVELIHAASLLHDDVIDDAMTRRGVSSVNATQGSKTSIMLGDILYSKAFATLVEFDDSIASRIASAVTSLSVGEMIDVEMASSFNKDEDKYLEMIYLKTASLIEACSACGAILAGKDPEKFALYGKNLGLAFQIIDDILDITSDEETLGKPALNDFIEGKCTLPYIYLYEALDPVDKKRLTSCHSRKISDLDSEWIKEEMVKLKTIEKSYMLAQKLTQEAIEAVKGEKELVNILESMMKRNF